MKYYIEADNDREIGDGFVPKTDDWRDDLDWADLIVFDDIWPPRRDPGIIIMCVARRYKFEVLDEEPVRISIMNIGRRDYLNINHGYR